MSHSELQGIRSYLVPVDGSEAAYHALGAACEIAKRQRAALHVLHVIEVARTVALEDVLDVDVQRGEQILEQAERVASGFGVSVEGDLLQARQAGHAVVDEAVDRQVDAIVIGVEYHRPLGVFGLGRLPTYVLEHAPTQVWLIRYPPASMPA
ncbi:MAG: universal stress protein [Dehalococcoidia bacterium]